MDARPQRSRLAIPAIGSENIPLSKNEALHQRHKSTGNLHNAARNDGLQAAAKRTVFGDVSNVMKNVRPGVGTAAKGKADVSTKSEASQAPQGFSKPAQRSAIPPVSKHDSIVVESRASNKLVVHSDRQARPDHQSSNPLPTQGTEVATIGLGIDNYATASSEIYPLDIQDILNDRNVQQSETQAPSEQPNRSSLFLDELDADQAALACLSVQDEPIGPAELSSGLQPRHVKSQPALKHMSVSETNTHLLEPAGNQVHNLADDVTEVAYEDALEHILDDQHFNSADARQIEAPAKSVAEYPSGQIHVSKATAAQTMDPKLIADLPDEYFGDIEEEELYEDQGYTTAHSYGSRGDLTTGGVTTLLGPRMTDNVERELCAARKHVESTRSAEEVDDDAWDVCMVAEYGEEIFQYLRELEAKMLPDPHYMDHQMEIQWSMRSVLMDWLVQVHSRFNLLPETLFLTVNYIDRFLTYKAVSISKLQLVGATALLVASKYEEINCPSLEEIAYMVDGSYAVEEILKAERFMLSMLGFELGWPGPMSFLRRISKADDYDLETRTLAKYFLEVTIMDERFVASPPSYLAAGAHCLSRLILSKGDWSLSHVHFSGYTWMQLKPLVCMILECCYAPRDHHQAVFEKYSDKRYKRASDFVQAEIQNGFSIPARSTGHCLSVMDNANFEGDSGFVSLPNAMVPVELRG